MATLRNRDSTKSCCPGRCATSDNSAAALIHPFYVPVACLAHAIDERQADGYSSSMWAKSRATPSPPGLILAFRADGPYWSDLVHILAYPDGVSYIWPFRYDARYVDPTLIDSLKTDEARAALPN